MFDDFAGRSSAFKSAFLKTLILTTVCFFLASGVWLADRMALRVELTTYMFSYGFFANALPFVMLFLLLMAVVNRLTLASAATALLAAVIYYADHQKFKFLSVPVSFNDIFLLRDIDASTIHLLSNYVNPWYLLSAVLLVVALVTGSMLREPAFFRKKSFVRPLIGLATVGLSISLIVGGKLASDIYGPGKLRVVPWAPLQTILHSGLLSSIEYSNLDYSRALDVPVDRRAIKAFTDMAVDQSSTDVEGNGTILASDQKPDIVIIQSESFFDPVILRDVDSSETLLPNLHRALSRATGGTMKAPTFGGGTLRTEFEVLTGIPMDAYPKIDFPYLQISQKSIPSLVGVLHHDGYATYAVHGNSGGFWNRDKAFSEMGFDRFLTKADFPKNAKADGWFLSDEAMTDQIIALLEKSSAPTMIFAVSIEGHGPYEHAPVDDMKKRNAIAVPSGWPVAAVNEYKNYMYHIGNADQQMGRLWAYLATRHRPYVLAFYGDHLPALQNVYALSGFDDHLDGPSEFVPWFVLNGAQTTPLNKHIHAWMLGGEVLSAAGLDKPPYYQALGKSERLLDGHMDAAGKDAVLQGVDSMARLYLSGKFDQEMPLIEAQESVK